MVAHVGAWTADAGREPMKIVMSAYACEPNKGSEPGVGWNWAREIAKHHDVWVITRANNRAVIEAESTSLPESLHFSYVDLPVWARFWKRGPRGARLYYVLWQFAALKRARSLHAELRFDVAHHITFATAYIGALIGLLPIPFIWGPVGGCSRVPWRLARLGGIRGLSYEALRTLRRAIGRFVDPFVRLNWRRADLILAQNPAAVEWLPVRYRDKALVWPGAGYDPERIAPRAALRRSDLLSLVVAGRLVHLKGVELSLRAVARLEGIRFRLIIAGDGPDRHRLENLASSLGIASQVEFRGWMTQEQLLQLFSRSDVLLFPSLHDEAPMVVIEAMACGVVPIVLDVGGSPILVADGGMIVQPSSVELTIAELANSIRHLAATSTRDHYRAKASLRAAEFRWKRRIRVLPFISPEQHSAAPHESAGRCQPE